MQRSAPLQLSAIATAIDAQLEGPDLLISAVGSLAGSGPEQITFHKSGHPLPETIRAGALIVEMEAPRARYPEAVSLLRTREPYLGFALALRLFHPDPPPPFTGISPLAVIDASATVGSDPSIAAGVHIGARTRIGDRVVLHPGVSIAEDVEVGDDVELLPNVVLYSRTTLGDRIRIHSGAAIGADGFGYAGSSAGAVKIPHIGRTLIESDVEIGANTCIDRGVVDDTVIGAGTKIDNLVQIGHNCRIGPHCFLAGQVGLGGSTTVGAGAKLGGQVGVAGHLTIGAGAQIGGKSGVTHAVPDGARYYGYPATELRTALRAMAILYKLPELGKHVDRISQRLEELIGDE